MKCVIAYKYLNNMKRAKGTEEYLKKCWLFFPSLMKIINAQIQDTHQIPNICREKRYEAH
jgi:hypothetical protein